MQSKKLSVLVGSLAAAALMYTGCGSSNSNNGTAPAPVQGAELPTSTIGAANLTKIKTSAKMSSAFAWISAYEPTTAGKTVDTTTLTSEITADLTLDATKIYAINGEVTVKNNATLTIPAGTILYGATGSSFLAVDPGAKIVANGTATSPVLFTSKADVESGFTQSIDIQGQWGGLSIFGNATTTRTSDGTSVETYEAGAHTFGGTTDTDNSGVLTYVILKHSGYEVEVGKELNGFSFGGVGSGTTIENIASISGSDDGIELWGGTVNLKNVFVYNAADDSLDFDHGWTGSADNVYLQQNIVDDTSSRGIESDTDGGHEDRTPASNPTISNITIITAADGGQGIMSREAAGGHYSNGLIIANNPAKAAIAVRSAKTLTNGLSYTGMTLVQPAGKYYEGHDENLADNIIGTVTAAEVQALVEADSNISTATAFGAK